MSTNEHGSRATASPGRVDPNAPTFQRNGTPSLLVPGSSSSSSNSSNSGSSGSSGSSVDACGTKVSTRTATDCLAMTEAETIPPAHHATLSPYLRLQQEPKNTGEFGLETAPPSMSAFAVDRPVNPGNSNRSESVREDYLVAATSSGSGGAARCAGTESIVGRERGIAAEYSHPGHAHHADQHEPSYGDVDVTAPAVDGGNGSGDCARMNGVQGRNTTFCLAPQAFAQRGGNTGEGHVSFAGANSHQERSNGFQTGEARRSLVQARRTDGRLALAADPLDPTGVRGHTLAPSVQHFMDHDSGPPKRTRDVASLMDGGCEAEGGGPKAVQDQHMSAELRLERSREQNRLSSKKARLRRKGEEVNLKEQIENIKLFRLMVEEGPDMMSIHGLDHRAPFRYASSAFQRVAGINPRDILGRGLTELIAKEHHETVQQALLKVVLSHANDYVISYRMLTPEGVLLLVETSIRAGDQCIICVARAVNDGPQPTPGPSTSNAMFGAHTAVSGGNAYGGIDGVGGGSGAGRSSGQGRAGMLPGMVAHAGDPAGDGGQVIQFSGTVGCRGTGSSNGGSHPADEHTFSDLRKGGHGGAMVQRLPRGCWGGGGGLGGGVSGRPRSTESSDVDSEAD